MGATLDVQCLNSPPSRPSVRDFGSTGSVFAPKDPDLPAARGAVGYGMVTARDGDYFGSVVNVVARASKVAVPNGIVVTAEVARFLDPESWLTESIGPHDLRGVGENVHLSRATPLSPGT